MTTWWRVGLMRCTGRTPPGADGCLGLVLQLLSLHVCADDNPVVSHPYFRALAILALPSLSRLNDVEVTAQARRRMGCGWRHARVLELLPRTAAGR